MARGHLRERLVSNVTGLPLGNAVVTVRLPGTGTASSATLYRALTGGTTWTNPITTGTDGVIDFYVDVPDDFDLRVVAAGYPDATIASVKALYAQADLVSLTGTQTLTNKPLTSPTLNTPTISGPVFSPAYEPRNLTIKNAAGSTDLAHYLDGLTYLAGPVRLGNHAGADDTATTDTAHAMYLHHTLSGTPTMVDQLICELTVNPTSDWDAGAILGVVRAASGAGKASIRGLAGQLFVYSGIPVAVDREAVELGVHNALTVVSKADNPSTFDAVYGTTGILILSYSGAIESGGSAVPANTAIVVGATGSGAGFKQFLVFWDTAGAKAYQVNDIGSVDMAGHLTMTGTSRLIIGDFDHATVNNRTYFQGKSSGGVSRVGVLPNGASTTSSLEALNASTATNAGLARLEATTGAINLEAGRNGSGTYLPLVLKTNNATAVTVTTTGEMQAAVGIRNNGTDIGSLSIPSALTANTENYVPSTGTGFGAYQISSTGAVELRGLALGQTIAGHRVTLVNGGGNTITIVHNAAGSSANPFNTHTGANHALTSGRSVSVIWTGAAWRFTALT